MGAQKKDDILRRLAGEPGESTDYIVYMELESGDYDYHSPGRHDPVQVYRFATLEDALQFLKGRFGDDASLPCPEHDLIEVWEVLPSGHRKIVWHFSGWHYDPSSRTTLEQGKLPGGDKSLYDRALADYWEGEVLG